MKLDIILTLDIICAAFLGKILILSVALVVQSSKSWLPGTASLSGQLVEDKGLYAGGGGYEQSYGHFLRLSGLICFFVFFYLCFSTIQQGLNNSQMWL